MERLDAFMARAAAAYYARPGAIGGDFTTAPEISQAFGEVLGAWCAVMWDRMGRPDPVILVECGPGRGTLMADALRALEAVAPDFRAALRLHLVEMSPALREAQRRVLGEAVWHADVTSLPDGPLLLIANEFLDALPIRQFARRGEGWVERYVSEGAFVDVGVPPQAMPFPPRQCGGFDAAGVGGPRFAGEAVLETCEAAQSIIATLAARPRLAALFIDYGHEAGFGDTLQAVARHATGLDPLADPGSRDLTAHVDFGALAQVAKAAGAAAHGPLPQGVLLQRLGLATRAAMLAQARPRLARDILSGAERLLAPERMGRLFKALAVCDPALGIPPGFEAA
jgi:NADH dehydrogenase [ubiquinone] 1 alpha subcomplex assembly factor 7